jgi:hypothetical protein
MLEWIVTSVGIANKQHSHGNAGLGKGCGIMGSAAADQAGGDPQLRRPCLEARTDHRCHGGDGCPRCGAKLELHVAARRDCIRDGMDAFLQLRERLRAQTADIKAERDLAGILGQGMLNSIALVTGNGDAWVVYLPGKFYLHSFPTRYRTKREQSA